MRPGKIAGLGSVVIACGLVAGATAVQAARPVPGQFTFPQGICGSVVAVAVQNPGSTTGTERIFAAARSLNSVCAGVFRSADGGQTFTKVGITNPGFSPPVIYDIATKGARVFVATSQGIWTTLDSNLITWTQHLGGLPNGAEITSVTPILSFGDVYATVAPDALNGQGGLWRSSDIGNTWTQVKPGLNVVAVTRPLGCGIPYNDDWVVAAAQPYPGALPGGIWYSQDRGLTWGQMTTWPTAQARDVEFDCFGNPSTNKNFRHLFVSNSDPGVSAAVFRSTDVGLSFQADNQGIPGCCGHTLRPSDGAPNHAPGGRVGSNGTGLYERGVTPKLGSAWKQFTTVGLPPNPAVTDWDMALKPGTTNVFRRIVVVNGGLYYHQP